MSDAESKAIYPYDPRRHMLQLSPVDGSYVRFCNDLITKMAAALSMPRHLTYGGRLPTRYSHCKGRAWPKMPRRLRNLRNVEC